MTDKEITKEELIFNLMAERDLLHKCFKDLLENINPIINMLYQSLERTQVLVEKFDILKKE